MNYYILVPFCSFVIELFAFTYILAQESKNPVNKAYLFFTLNIILWSLNDLIAWCPIDKSWLYPLMKFGSLYWLSLGFVFINFIYTFLKIKRNAVYYAFFLLAVTSICISFTTRLVVQDAVLFYWGTDIIRGILFNPFIFLVIIVPFIYSFFLLYSCLKKKPEYFHKKQLQLVLYGSAIAFTIGIIFDFIIPHLLHIRKFIQPGASPAVIHTIFIFIAITKYKFFNIGIEEAASELFSNISDGIILVDKNDKVMQINPVAKKILQLNGINLQTVDLPSVLSGYEHQKEYHEYELMISKNGQNGFLSISQSILYQDRHVIGKILIIRDITDKRKSEESLKLYANKLEQKNKELDEFASIISHDLNEPLRKIKMNCSKVKKYTPEGPESSSREHIEKIEGSAERMQILINALLNYARVTTQKTPLPFVKVCLETTVKEVVSDLEARITETGGQVITNNLPVIEANKLQMQQLFQNLIGNALKFHKPNIPPVVTIDSISLTNNMFEIIIKDNGVGFDEKYIDKIFKPFQRLHHKNEFEGTGMGTAICKKIVLHHGGKITAQSKINIGTTFSITLPKKQTNEM